MVAEPFRSNCRCSLPNCIGACCDAIEGTPCKSVNAGCEHFAGIGGTVSLAFGIIVAFDQRPKVVRLLAREKALLRCKSAISAATAIFSLYNSAKRTSDGDGRRLHRVRGMSKHRKTHGVDARIGERLPQMALSQGAVDTT